MHDPRTDDIIAMFRLLDQESQQYVIRLLQQELHNPPLSLGEWLEMVKAIAITPPETTGAPPTTSLDVLDEVREERDETIIRSVGRGRAANNSAD